jgi:ABC-type branched-subunit amino acid transport system permease subunit
LRLFLLNEAWLTPGANGVTAIPRPFRAPRLRRAPRSSRRQRFAKDVIPFLTGVRLAAAQQILVGVVLVVLMIRRPEGLLPEKPGSA